MNNKKCYAVVTTVYNDEKYIKRYMSDILSQTLAPSEIVIADGGSTDNILEIVEEYRKKVCIPIIFLYGKRLNISEGYNSAIKKAKEKILMITSVGNRYPEDCFEKLLEQVEKNNYDAAYTAVKGSTDTDFSRGYNKGILHNYIIMDIPSNHGTMIKKEVIEELDYFYEGFFYAGEDLEFYTRFRKNKKTSICLKNEYIIWDVPKDNKEFKKQIKLYQIADMQIYNNIFIFLRVLKNVVMLSLPIVTIICILFFTRFLKKIGIILLLLWGGYNLAYIIKYTLLGWLLYIEKKWLQLLYIAQNVGYLKDTNKIIKERRV